MYTRKRHVEIVNPFLPGYDSEEGSTLPCKWRLAFDLSCIFQVPFSPKFDSELSTASMQFLIHEVIGARFF